MLEEKARKERHDAEDSVSMAQRMEAAAEDMQRQTRLMATMLTSEQFRSGESRSLSQLSGFMEGVILRVLCLERRRKMTPAIATPFKCLTSHALAVSR